MKLAYLVVRRVLKNTGHHTLGMEAAGIAFWGMLAAFPALAAFISLYALMANPSQVVEQLAALRSILPEEAANLVHEQLVRLGNERSGHLTFGALFGFLLTFYSAGSGVRALITSLNVVYMEPERRGIVRFYLIASAFTVAVICLGALSLTTIVVTPVVLNLIRLGSWSEMLVDLLRWPIVLMFVMAVLALFYKYGASRTPPKLRWVFPGTIVAAIGWFIASYLFSAYVASFANYNETYGTLGAVVILLTWFFLSAYLFLIGAEVNAALEFFALEDTTEGPPMPVGLRGAHVADVEPANDPLPEPTLAEAAGVGSGKEIDAA